MPTRTIVKGHRVVTPDGIVSPGWVVIEDGEIITVDPTFPAIEHAALLKADIVVPGFIDIHTRAPARLRRCLDARRGGRT